MPLSAFEDLFFNASNNRSTFIQVVKEPSLIVGQTTLTTWSAFFGKNQPFIEQLLLQSNIWTYERHQRNDVRVTSSVSMNRFYKGFTSITYSIPKLAVGIANQICELNQLTSDEITQVNQTYERLVKEIVNYIIDNNRLDFRAKKELLTHYHNEWTAASLKSGKNLTGQNLSHEYFETEVNSYQAQLQLLLARVVKENLVTRSALLNLYVLLVYQVKNPHLFKENNREKWVRYVSHTLACLLFLATALTEFMLFLLASCSGILLVNLFLIAFEPLLVGASLFVVIPTTFFSGLLAVLPLIAFVVAYYSLDSYVVQHTDYKDLQSFIYSQFSRFFFSAFEWALGCETYEFEMTRILEKGREYELDSDMPGLVDYNEQNKQEGPLDQRMI